MPTNSNPLDPRQASLSKAKRKLLEQRLNRTAKPSNTAPQISLKRPENTKPIASPGQKRIWLVEQLNPNSSAYNITSSFNCEGSFDYNLLGLSLNKVVAQHEILRTVFRWDNDELLYEIRNKLNVEIIVETTKNPQATAIAHAQELFDLKNGPLLKLVVIQGKDGSTKLMLVVHHIIFDEWSLGLFWKEFQKHYNASKPENEISPEYQYSDFAYWQNEQLATNKFSNQLLYWKSKLINTPSKLNLPIASNKSIQRSNTGRIESAKIDSATTKKLKQLARSENISTFSALLLGFKILLHRYSNTDNIVVGIPIANRRKKEFSNLIGFFLNTAAVRSDLGGNPTLGEALKRVNQSVLGALENQDIPFDAVIEAVKPERTNGMQSLAQIMFVYQKNNEASPKLTLKGTTLSHTFTETRSSKLDLTLFATDSDNQIELFFEYKESLFKPEVVRSMLEHFRTLVCSMVSSPQSSLSKIEMIPRLEKDTLLQQSQGQRIPINEIPLLPAQINEHAKNTPNVIAIETDSDSISYQQLFERASSLANRLIDTGVSSTRPVAIFMDRSIDAIIAILATLNAGSHYLPIDPSYPNNRHSIILNDAKPSVIITTKEYKQRVESFTNTPVITSWDSLPSINPCTVDSNQLAYIIYTSGSTGKPKGVSISHDNLRYSTFARTNYYQRNPKRFLLLPSLSFDSSVAVIFWTLSSGGTLVLPKPGQEKEPDTLRNLISNHNVSNLLCIPSLYREIIANEKNKLISLRDVIVAGESCPYELVEDHYNATSKCTLYNEYGPTESTVWCTAEKLSIGNPVTIGKPIPNYGAYVLGSQRQLQPNGIPGELFISGPGLAFGYVNNEKLTEDRFASVQISEEHTIRMYRTGDKVRRLENKCLEFIGRIDDQVKIRGYRLELGEIEASLKSDHEISDAAVIPITEQVNQQEQTRLIGFICVSDIQSHDIKKTRDQLAINLPPHAIPSQFVILESLPRLPNGKIDRKSLPVPSRYRQTSSDLVQPACSIEAELVEIWKEVLSLPRVSTNDDFFELGGTSLQAIRLFSRIAENFNSKLSAGQLLQSSTIAKLAKLLNGKNHSKTKSNLIKFKDGEKHTPIFLVPSGGLEILFYRPLTEHIDNSIPIYGIQPVGFKADDTPLLSVNEMASHYINEIKTILPNGPFSLIGHCFGATIAIEMAKQLRAKNINVPLVVSLDGQAPRPVGYVEPGGPSFAKKLANPNLFIDDLRKLSGNPIRRIKEYNISKNGNFKQKTNLLIRKTGRIVRNAFVAYRAAPYRAEVLAFNCTESKASARHTLAAWKESAPNVKMMTIDCLHSDILKEPFVQQVAKKLNGKLIGTHSNRR